MCVFVNVSCVGMGQSGHNSGDSLQIAAMELALHIHDSHPPNPLDPSLFSLARPVCLYFSRVYQCSVSQSYTAGQEGLFPHFLFHV